MPEEGDLRPNRGMFFGVGGDRWDVFLEGKWKDLASEDAAMASALEPYDAIRVSESGIEEIRKRGTDEWVPADSVLDPEHWAAMQQLPPRPDSFPTYRPWPPLEKDGSPDYNLIDDYLKEAAARLPGGQFSSEEEAEGFVSETPGLEGFESFFDPKTGTFRLKEADAFSLGRFGSVTPAERAFMQQQQQGGGAQRAPSSQDRLGLLLDQAIMTGNWDKAIAYNDFLEAPSRLEAMQFAMQYAESPEEFQALFQMAIGPRPQTAFGEQAEPEPAFQAPSQTSQQIQQAAQMTVDTLRSQGMDEATIRGVVGPGFERLTPLSGPAHAAEAEGFALPEARALMGDITEAELAGALLPEAGPEAGPFPAGPQAFGPPGIDLRRTPEEAQAFARGPSERAMASAGMAAVNAPGGFVWDPNQGGWAQRPQPRLRRQPQQAPQQVQGFDLPPELKAVFERRRRGRQVPPQRLPFGPAFR